MNTQKVAQKMLKLAKMLVANDWLTIEQVAGICPACARKMVKARVKQIRASAFNVTADMTWEECIKEAEKNKDVRDPEALCGWLRRHGPNVPAGKRKGPFKSSVIADEECDDDMNQLAQNLLDTARGLVSGEKKVVAVDQGDLCSVDMAVIRREDVRRGMGMGHWLKVVRDTVHYGGGLVKVLKVWRDEADVIADGPMGAVMGSVTVPVQALRVASANRMAIAKRLVRIARFVLESGDTPEDVATDVVTRMSRGMDVAKAFRDIGYSKLYSKTLENDMPDDWESLSKSTKIKAMTKAIEKAVRR